MVANDTDHFLVQLARLRAMRPAGVRECAPRRPRPRDWIRVWLRPTRAFELSQQLTDLIVSISTRAKPAAAGSAS